MSLFSHKFIFRRCLKVIVQETLELIDRLLLEKIPLAGIARATQVSEKELQKYVNDKYAQVAQQIHISEKSKGKLTIECDEAWSFVRNKDNKQWIWLAMHKKTREIVGVYIGDYSKESAQKLWDSLPPVYRQCAVCYTDFWVSYYEVFPQKRHKTEGIREWSNQPY